MDWYPLYAAGSDRRCLSSADGWMNRVPRNCPTNLVQMRIWERDGQFRLPDRHMSRIFPHIVSTLLASPGEVGGHRPHSESSTPVPAGRNPQSFLLYTLCCEAVPSPIPGENVSSTPPPAEMNGCGNRCSGES